MGRNKIGADSSKGYRIESLAVSACEVLRKQGEILSYVHAQPGRQLDSEGIDVLVQLNNGLFFGLQCKSSLLAVGDHFKKHPKITYILVVGSFPGRQVRSWWARPEVKKFIVRSIPSRTCVQVLNTRSEVREGVRSYDKILEQAIVKMRALIAAAKAAGGNI